MQLMHSTLTPLRVFDDGLEPAGFAELEAVFSSEDQLDDDCVARRQQIVDIDIFHDLTVEAFRTGF
jgi:hypothetical protein